MLKIGKYHLVLFITICILIYLITVKINSDQINLVTTILNPLFLNSSASNGRLPLPYYGKVRPSDLQVFTKLEKKYSNWPLVYLYQNKRNHWHHKNGSNCAKFPQIYELQFNNLYWQEYQHNNGKIYLYKAYLDIRKNNPLGATVRILAMAKKDQFDSKTFCQFWFHNHTVPIIQQVKEFQIIQVHSYENTKRTLPFLISCQIPPGEWSNKASLSLMASVSLVHNPCDSPKNSLKVNYNKPTNGKKEKFAVCTKALDYPNVDISITLVQWLEMLRELGAHKVFIYNLASHPNITKVLNHYSQSGFLQVTPFMLAGTQPNLGELRHVFLWHEFPHFTQPLNEKIQYNDCIYQNMYRYEHIGVFDVDEIIMPTKHQNWQEMMDSILQNPKAKDRSGISFKNTYFNEENLQYLGKTYAKDIPVYLDLFQHVYRSPYYGSNIPKSFNNPEIVKLVHSHSALLCLKGNCDAFEASSELGFSHHHRKYPPMKSLKDVGEPFEDKTIYRWKDRVIPKILKVLKTLNLI